MDQAGLDALGIPRELKDRLTPYLGLKGVAAEEALHAPLTISPEDADQLNAAVQAAKVQLVRERYDAVAGPTGVSFGELPAGAQTVILSIAFQWGSIWARSSPPDIPLFWQAAVDRDWKMAVSVLRAWAPKPWRGTVYRTRRLSEADYLAST